MTKLLKITSSCLSTFMFLLLWVCLLKVSAKRTRNNIQHVLVCSLWTRTWTHSCRFTQRRRQKKLQKRKARLWKKGSVESRRRKYRHRLSQHKIRPYWKRFHLFDWRAKFLSRSSTFVGELLRIRQSKLAFRQSNGCFSKVLSVCPQKTAFTPSQDGGTDLSPRPANTK